MMLSRLRQSVSYWGQRGLAMLIFGGVMGVAGILLYEYVEMTFSYRWLPHQATVIANNQIVSRSGRSRYFTNFKYEYTVDGIIYEGERLTFLEMISSGTRQQLQTFLDTYPKGATVPIWVSPSVSSRSVVWKRDYPFAMFTPLVCIIPGMILLWAIAAALWRVEKLSIT